MMPANSSISALDALTEPPPLEFAMALNIKFHTICVIVSGAVASAIARSDRYDLGFRV